MKKYWGVFYSPPGTTDNGAAASFAESKGDVTSGTASEAMINAAMAASSAAETPSGADGVTPIVTPEKPETAPAVVETAATVDAKKGPIPFERHEAALANARTKAAEEATTKALERFAWAQGLDPADVKAKLAVIARLYDDPKKFKADLEAEMKASGLIEEPEEAMPEADIVDPTGTLKTYSIDAFKKALAIETKKIAKQLRAEMAPLQERHKTDQEKADAATKQGHIDRVTASTMAGIRALPHFPKDKAEEGKILAEMRAIPAETRAAVGGVAALYMAFEAYKTKHVYPTLQATAAEEVRKANAKKAAGSSIVGPVDNGTEAKPNALRNVNDLAAHMAQLEASMSS